MTKRKAISTAMRDDAWMHRLWYEHGWWFRCAICGQPLIPGQRIEMDHIHAVTADGPHEHQNLRPLHRDCHKKKSAQDVALNAKAKRIAAGGRKRKGRKIKSAGFRPAPKGYVSPLSKEARQRRAR